MSPLFVISSFQFQNYSFLKSITPFLIGLNPPANSSQPAEADQIFGRREQFTIDMISYCPINNRNVDSSCECLGTRKYLCKGQPSSVREAVNGEKKSERHVTMVAKFLDHNNTELKLRRQRRQRELEKSNRFMSAQQQLCTCITLFRTFLSRRCTTAT